MEPSRSDNIHAQIAIRAYQRWEKEGALSVPLRRTGLMQKRSCGFFWTCRDSPSHRYQWKL